MADVTEILHSIEDGDPSAAEELLPLIYDELRKLAAAKMAQESPDHTLQATALVHEAYLRLVDVEKAQHWNSRGHFYGAAAEAMRRILIENARRKVRQKHGGQLQHVPLQPEDLISETPPEELLAIDDALTKLEKTDRQAARLVELQYFAGLTVEEAANLMGIPRSTAYEHWAYARARLQCEMMGD